MTCDTAAEAEESARLIFKVCQNMGFDPRIETANANEGWLGSIPIHGWYDVRKPLVSTRNLVDIMPLTSIWSGLAVNPVSLLSRRIRRRSATVRPPAARLSASISIVADTGTLADRGTDRRGQERGTRRNRRERPRRSAVCRSSSWTRAIPLSS